MQLSVSASEPQCGIDTPVTTEIRFSSDPLLVPGICSAAANFATLPELGGQPKLTLVLKELLSNAVDHGNQRDSSRSVLCRLTRLGIRVIEIMITDEGAGFDLSAVNYRLPDAPQESSRCGLRLVNALSSDLHFEDGGKTVICRVSLDGDMVPDEQTTSTNNPSKEI